jgi:hypothetical protein
MTAKPRRQIVSHTGGRWFIVSGDMPNPIQGCIARLDVRCYIYSTREPRNFAEVMANAHLMQAGPRMFKALRSLMNVIEKQHGVLSGHQARRAMSRATRAIFDAAPRTERSVQPE